MPHMVGNVSTEISCTQKGLLKAVIHCETSVVNCRKATVASLRARAYWESCCKVRSGIWSGGEIAVWRAAAIVLNDLASSAYYAGGEAEGYIGKTAPWFILAIMLFSYTVRAVYVESCSMFVRGGVYRAVKQSLGGALAKFSVSALMFDYILTGPISGVAAGQYVGGLVSELLPYAHLTTAPLAPRYIDIIASCFAII